MHIVRGAMRHACVRKAQGEAPDLPVAGVPACDFNMLLLCVHMCVCAHAHVRSIVRHPRAVHLIMLYADIFRWNVICASVCAHNVIGTIGATRATRVSLPVFNASLVFFLWLLRCCWSYWHSASRNSAAQLAQLNIVIIIGVFPLLCAV